jgi:hypothetical protein
MSVDGLSRVTARRLRDFLIYIAIALAIGLGIAWYAYAGPPTQSDAIARWGGLALNTIVLFEYMIRDSKPVWRVPAFWVLMLAMLSAHIVVFAAILLHARAWKVLWFLVMYPIEVPIFYFARDRIVGLGLPRHRI